MLASIGDSHFNISTTLLLGGGLPTDWIGQRDLILLG